MAGFPWSNICLMSNVHSVSGVCPSERSYTVCVKGSCLKWIQIRVSHYATVAGYESHWLLLCFVSAGSH